MTYELYRGDCLEEMARIEAGSIDAIIADLPYGTTACKWDSVIPLEPLWVQFKRVLKERGAVVLFGAQPFTTALISSNFEWFKYQWVWQKTRPTDHVRAKHKPLTAHEDVIIFSPANATTGTDNPMTYNPQGIVYDPVIERRPGRKVSAINGDGPWMKAEYRRDYKNYPRTVIEFSNPNNGNVHPTQKPTDLLEYLVKTYTNEGEMVLDCTMGSGTTGVACMNTGRNFIGIELEREYFEIAERRIKEASEAARQLELL